MNIGTLDIVLLSIIALNVLFLIALHVIGDIRTVRRRLRDIDAKRSGRRDRYRPSLSVFVYHTQDSADIRQCMDAIRTNPYPVEQIIIIDMMGSAFVQKATNDYRKQHSDIEVSYRSFANEASWKKQTGSVQKLISSKLVMAIDSSVALQSDNLLPAIKTFRNPGLIGIVGQIGLLPRTSLSSGIYAARQALINNFRRAFSGTRLHVTRGRHAVIIMRAHALRRIIDKHDGVLPADVTSYGNEDFLGKSNRLVMSADLRAWTDNLRFRLRSILFILTMLSFGIFAGFIIAKLGIYNSLPLILALLLVLIVFAGLSQPKHTAYSIFDKFSIALLAPFTVLLPLVTLRFRLKKS